MTPETESPGKMRKFTVTSASDAKTFAASLPLAMVIAVVVRTNALDAGDFSIVLSNNGLSSH